MFACSLLIDFDKLWNIDFEILKYLSFSHTFTYNRILCTHSHREAVTSIIGNLGEASSQLSWGVNLRMGSQNTFTQIEPFSITVYNGWGLGCPTSPIWTIVGNNLGAIRVIQSRNKCSDTKSALVRAIPFRRNYLKLGHVKNTFVFFFFCRC